MADLPFQCPPFCASGRALGLIKLNSRQYPEVDIQIETLVIVPT
ncbi:hypothetical protein [Parasphingorhabdus sp. NYA22]